MLIYPSIDNLLEKVDSKYSLATLAAKRAHDFEDEETPTRELLEEYQTKSNVGRSLEEIASGDLVLDPDSVDSENF